MNSKRKRSVKLSVKQLRERQREYWRRWKERNTPKHISKLGWQADFERNLWGWHWKATHSKNGAVLENGPFESIAKAKQDFLEAIE